MFISKSIRNLSISAFLVASCGFFGGGSNVWANAETPLYEVTTLPDAPNDDWFFMDPHFGSSVAMSDDGNRVIIGAPGEDADCYWDYSNCPGNAHIYAWDGSSWFEETILVSPASSQTQYGMTVAIDGDFAMVGAPFHKGTDGKVYVYRYDSGSSDWNLFSTISGTVTDEFFGSSMALRNGVAAIGAWKHDNFGGKVYVYKVDANPFSLLAELTPSDGNDQDRFGEAVAMSGDMIIVGSPRSDGDDIDMGAAYIFREVDNVWGEEAKLFPWKATAGESLASDTFGSSVSISGNLAIVGSPAHDSDGLFNKGAAYIYRYIGGVWEPESKVSDSALGAAKNDNFGKSVAIYGNHAFIGAPGYSDENYGAGYLIGEVGCDWILVDKFDGEIYQPDWDVTAIGTAVALGAHGFVIGGINHIAHIGRFSQTLQEPNNDGGDNIDDGNSPDLGDTTTGGNFDQNGSLRSIGYNNATLVANSNSYFTFTCTNSDPDLLVYAAIIANSHCTGEISSMEINPNTPTARLVSEVVADPSIATLIRNFQDELNLANVNKGFDLLEYCIRCDIYHKDHPDFSIMARKFDLSLDITFETSVNFKVDSILTEEFIADDVKTSDERSVPIEVFKGDCDSNPTCNVVEDNCFSGANSVTIGETLELCIKAQDSDVVIRGIERATAAAGAFVSPIVRSDTAGEVGSTNFVTKSEVNGAGEVTLSTLLIPAYYDALKNSANDFISVSGVALLEYVSVTRRLGHTENDRSLQVTGSNLSAFAVSIPLEDRDTPLVARSRMNSSAGTVGPRMTTVVAIVGVGLFSLF